MGAAADISIEDGNTRTRHPRFGDEEHGGLGTGLRKGWNGLLAQGESNIFKCIFYRLGVRAPKACPAAMQKDAEIQISAGGCCLAI